MSRILAVGNAVMDVVIDAECYPTENTENRMVQLSEVVGGNCINSLSVLHQLNHQTAWSGTYTLDSRGDMLTQSLTRLGIDFEHAQRIKSGKTPTSIVIRSADTASRTIFHHRDLPELDFEFFALQSIENFDWIHFEGRNLDNLEGMINLAKCFAQHQRLSLELEKNREGLMDLIDQVDVLMCSQAFVMSQGFTAPSDFLNAIRPKLKSNAQVFCAWGNKGAWALNPTGDIAHVAANPSLKVVDTLGAGDVFNAGVIHGCLQELSTVDVLALAVNLAEKKIQQQGLHALFKHDHQTRLAHIDQLSAHKVMVVEHQGQSIALLRHQNGVKAYLNHCPHANVPLNSMYKIEVDPRALTLKCSVHDALFDIDQGHCVAGPCRNQKLTAIACVLDDQGSVFLD